MAPAVTLTRDDARRRLVAHLGLARSCGRGARGSRAVLDRLRCIQVDPLDAIGTNADLVVMARAENVSRGDLWQHLFPRHAFEHFAKERCILPATSFARYRAKGHEAGVRWWRHHEREARIPDALLDAVLSEVQARGPVTARDLEDHGPVAPIDWNGWKGTARATTMAIEILWTRCDIVVAGRDGSGSKLYDIPDRAIATTGDESADDFERWALLERARAAGLLSRAGCATWSTLSHIRTSTLPDEMVANGELVAVTVEGSKRSYLTTPEFLAPRRFRYDDRVRILGPLDPLVWDRDLVRNAFEFDYVWEVYKPARTRRWGWYVCPLLHRDRLVGRIDAKARGTLFGIRKLWIEGDVARGPVEAAIERHAGLCGCSRIRWPRGWR